MKRSILGCAAVALAAIVGCNESPRGGGTGTAAGRDAGRASETFTIKAPAMATNINQGDQETVKLTVDRGDDFKKAVTLKVDAPKGIEVTLQPSNVKASDPEEVTATIKVANDAPVGDHVVKVTGTPESGAAPAVDFKVKVDTKKQ
jgi:uncharacterized membrane protein